MKSLALSLLLTIGVGFSSEYEPLEYGLVEKLTDEEMTSIRLWAENSKVALPYRTYWNTWRE